MSNVLKSTCSDSEWVVVVLTTACVYSVAKVAAFFDFECFLVTQILQRHVYMVFLHRVYMCMSCMVVVCV